MRISTTLSVALLVVLGTAGAARALNAEADLSLGDRIYGNIETAGDFDRLRFDAPRDAELRFDVKFLDSGFVATIALYPPDDPSTPEPIAAYLSNSSSKVKLKNFPVRISGTWILEIRAATGTSGRYELKSKVEYRGSWKTEDPLASLGEASMAFAAAAGSTLKIKVKVDEGDIDPVVRRLETPSGSTSLPTDLKQSDVPLPEFGDYALVVQNLAAVDGSLKVKLKVKTPDPDGARLYLSTRGYGPAPTIESRDPKKGLQGDTHDTVVIEGTDFHREASVTLQRSGKADVPAGTVVVVSDTQITCSLDLVGLKTGTWDLVVENPSGGKDDTSFKVKKPEDVNLPLGIRDDTEVWYIEFGDEFESDLALFGLNSSSDKVTEKAAETVMAYVIWDLREIFGRKGSSGKSRDDTIAVSFVVDEPTYLVGAAGETYNRLRIGGEVQPGDPRSDNPSVQWGHTHVDTGNKSFVDLSQDGGAGRGLFLRALNPGGANVTAAWREAFVSLVASPLTVSDEQYFEPRFDPRTTAESDRYAAIDGAIRTLARELSAVAAHHIARAMGLPNGASGISSTPATVGTFAGLAFPEFTEADFETLTGSVLESNLPGSSGTLYATYLPLRGLADFLLPEVMTAKNVTFELPFAGGRPDLRVDDVRYSGKYGSIPVGFELDQGTLGGLAPFAMDSIVYYGIFRFGIKLEDKVTGDEDRPDHRINLLINLDLVPIYQLSQAIEINAQIRAAL